jgi:gluconokinase
MASVPIIKNGVHNVINRLINGLDPFIFKAQSRLVNEAGTKIMLVVLFGLAGSGKTWVGKLLSKYSNFYFWDADEALTEEMKICIQEKRSFTQEMRDRYFNIVMERMEMLCVQYTNVVVAQAFYKNKNRQQVLGKFSDSLFIQVDVEFTILLNRIRKRNDAVDEMYAIKLRANFETPIHPYHSIRNDHENDIVSLLVQFRAIPVLAPLMKTGYRGLKNFAGPHRLFPEQQYANPEVCPYVETEMQNYGLKLFSGERRPKELQAISSAVMSAPSSIC